MSVEDERFDPSHFVPPWVRYEHEQRYAFAAQFVKDAVVIDCACGSGEGTRVYAEAQARTIYAYDLSPEAVSSTKRKCSTFPFVVSEIASATDIPLPDAIADVFISLETFEHLDSQVEFIREVSRVLKPGSIFICSTPNRTVYSPGNDLQSRPWNKFHKRELNYDEFYRSIEEVFMDIGLYAQNKTNAVYNKLTTEIGRRFGIVFAVRIRQTFKLFRFMTGRREHHAVIPFVKNKQYEYIVVVCRKKTT